MVSSAILSIRHVTTSPCAAKIVDAKIKSKMKFVKYYIDKDSVNFTRFTIDSGAELSKAGGHPETTDEMLNRRPSPRH